MHHTFTHVKYVDVVTFTGSADTAVDPRRNSAGLARALTRGMSPARGRVNAMSRADQGKYPG